MFFVEFLGRFATLTTSEFKVFAAFFPGPIEGELPDLVTNALTTDGLVGDEIFEIGVFADAWPHKDGDGDDTDDLVGFILGDNEVMPRGGDDIVKP